jgi:prepilin-type N-terminal cleavage/methylation domain-containing protein
MMMATCRRARQVDGMKGIYRRVRASRHGPFGFSLIELLIAVFLLGLVMAAMFPVFVLALKTNSGDAARNIALNIAQDRIEKVRQLDFDDVTTPNLESSTFYGGQFGKTYVDTRNGKSKTFDVFYAVKDVKPSETSTAVLYKEVTVAVTWTGEPKPVKRVELKTVVYRQWSGPQIQSVWLDDPEPGSPDMGQFSTLPITVQSQFASERWIPALTTQETVNIYLNPNDVLNNMQGVDSKGQPIKGWVSLLITTSGGTPVVPEQKLSDASSTDGSRYTYSWTNIDSAPDAMYTIVATAYSYDKSKGNTVMVRVRLETGEPPAPVYAKDGVGYRSADPADPGRGEVILDWDPVPADEALDIMCYEVKRFDATHESGKLIAGQSGDDPSAWLTGTALTDNDPDLRFGSDVYYYEVRAIDETYKPGPWLRIPFGSWDTTGPEPPAPANLAATVSGNLVNLTWDQPADTSIVSGYQVFKDGAVIGTVAGLDFSSDQGYLATGLYQVRSVNLQGTNFSAWCSIAIGQPSQLVDGQTWLLVQTAAQPLYTIRVRSNVPLGTHEELTAKLYTGQGGSGTGLQPLATWIGLKTGRTSDGVLNRPAGWYSVEWQVVNTKTNQIVQNWQYRDFSAPLSAGTEQILAIP